MTRIGLFGGTFDPVHNAHVALAKTALEALQLDELRWIPAGQPWQKSRQPTPAAAREAMLRLAIEGEPRFVLDRIELDRAGPSYTIDTVLELQASQPGADWFLIIGQDQYAGLPSWQRWQELLARVRLAVAGRPGTQAETDPRLAAFAVQRLPLPPLDISSTDLRRRAAAGADISTLVPPEVARYIEQHGLYRAVTGS